MHLWKYGVFGEDIENMETDLSDCIALTALYAMIKEGTEFVCRFVACHFDVRWTSKWIRWTGWARKKRLFWAGLYWVKENQWISWKVTYWMIANPSGPHCLERSWQRFEKRATLLLFARDFTDWKAGEWCCTCCHLSSCTDLPLYRAKSLLVPHEIAEGTRNSMCNQRISGIDDFCFENHLFWSIRMVSLSICEVTLRSCKLSWLLFLPCIQCFRREISNDSVIKLYFGWWYV